MWSKLTQKLSFHTPNWQIPWVICKPFGHDKKYWSYFKIRTIFCALQTGVNHGQVNRRPALSADIVTAYHHIHILLLFDDKTFCVCKTSEVCMFLDQFSKAAGLFWIQPRSVWIWFDYTTVPLLWMWFPAPLYKKVLSCWPLTSH